MSALHSSKKQMAQRVVGAQVELSVDTSFLIFYSMCAAAEVQREQLSGGPTQFQAKMLFV